jgi:hypothetical protein
MIIAAPGSRSEGLRINVFPVAIAIGIDQSGIMLIGIQLRKTVGIAMAECLTPES